MEQVFLTSTSFKPPILDWKKPGRKPIDHFQVFGERRSGTNFVDRLFADNFQISPVTNYGWKHGFPSMPCILESALIIVVVREPFSWLESLHNRPFVDSHKHLSFSDFLRSEWKGKYTPKWFGHRKWGYGGMPKEPGGTNQAERHPISGKPIKNPLELRALKNTAFLGFLERDCNALVVNYEAVKDNPLETIKAISEVFRVPVSDELIIPGKVGPTGTKKNRVRLEDIGPNDMNFILTNIDVELEARLGYTASIEDARRKLENT